MAPLDADVLRRRLAVLHEATAELERPSAADATELAANPMLRAAVERWVQVSIEACIDIADHAIAEHGWTPPETGRAAFATLAAHGLIPAALASRLGNAVGLRNLIVHQYAAIDLEILARIVKHDMGDLRELARYAAEWISNGP